MEGEIVIDVLFLNMLAGVLIPLLVSLVTKIKASSKFKALTNALLSAIAGAVAVAIQAQGQIDVEVVVLSIAATWIASMSSYNGFHKPTGTTSAVSSATSSVGFGGEDVI